MRTRGLRSAPGRGSCPPLPRGPPWELMNTVISRLTRRPRRAAVPSPPRRRACVISPLMITVRARNSRSAMRLYGGAAADSKGGGGSSSIGSPGLVAIVRLRPTLRPWRRCRSSSSARVTYFTPPRHLLPPREIEVGVVHRLRGTVAASEAPRWPRPAKVGSRERRAGSGTSCGQLATAAEHDPRLRYDSPCSPLPARCTPLDPSRGRPAPGSRTIRGGAACGTPRPSIRAGGSRTAARTSSGCS